MAMEYRREIDGLRAVAVIPVIFFHAGFKYFSGGFIGVDVFFVISGYLITTIIISELRKGTFSLVNFYERRARRILPALFLIMLVCSLSSWFWITPGNHKDFSQSLASVSIFSSNVFFWLKSGYFDTAAEMKPLLHTWSLAVEEQYYILFPIFLMLVWSYRKRWVFGAIIIIGAFSLLLAQWGSVNSPSASFYLLHTRAWELMIGGTAAFYLLYERSSHAFIRTHKIISEACGISGLALILTSVVLFNKDTPFPSFYTLIPTLGTALIILFTTKTTMVGKILGSRILVGIGLVSYSLYLWHQPLYVYARYQSITELEQWAYFPLILITILLSFLSWKFIEKPFRNKNTFGRKSIFTFAILGSTVFAMLGTAGHITNGFDSREFWFTNLLSYESDNRKLRSQTWSTLRSNSGNIFYGAVNNKFDNQLWFDLESDKAPLLIVGNSYSKDIYNLLTHTKSARDIYQFARYGVQISDLSDLTHPFYRSHNYTNSKVIILASRYTHNDINSLPIVLNEMLANNKVVFIVKSIFEFEHNPRHYLNLADLELHSHCATSCTSKDPESIANKINEAYYNNLVNPIYINSKARLINKRIDKISPKYNVAVLDRMDYICDKEIKQCFAINNKLQKYYFDYGHHTITGAKFFGNLIEEKQIWRELFIVD